MTFQVLVSPRAVSQVRQSSSWWARNRSLFQAQQWLQSFRAALNSLSHDPLRWPVATESDDLPIELREMLFGIGRRKTHRIVFEVDGDRVLVHAIRHLSQDKLSPDDFTG